MVRTTWRPGARAWAGALAATLVGALTGVAHAATPRPAGRVAGAVVTSYGGSQEGSSVDFARMTQRGLDTVHKHPLDRGVEVDGVAVRYQQVRNFADFDGA